MDTGVVSATVWQCLVLVLMNSFQEDRPSCPFLPAAESPIGAAAMREVGEDRGERFYLQALTCAQSLWRRGLPAQSVLLLNRAYSADLDGSETILVKWPLPYAAMHWVLSSKREGDFVGNPRRHFQHLATRMVEPRRELRSWRAWACWAFACELFPDCPADLLQIESEGVSEPGLDQIREKLASLGIPGEAELWMSILQQSTPQVEE